MSRCFDNPQTNCAAADGEELEFADAGQRWKISWCPPDTAPTGTPHGSAAICFTHQGDIVLVSATGGSTWEFPAGRPNGVEDWRTTMEREILEEACASVMDASLLGFSVGRCIDGRQKGLVLIRSLWRAMVTLAPWVPRHEMKDRRIVRLYSALNTIRIPQGAHPFYERWMQAALASVSPIAHR